MHIAHQPQNAGFIDDDTIQATQSFENHSTNTEGGTLVHRDVAVQQGDFIGRDQHIHGNVFYTPKDAAAYQTPFQVPELIPLVGREEELTAVQRALRAGERYCILQGMPGVGKTTLAIQAAYDVRDVFPDGILWAELSESNVMAILYAWAKAYGRDLREYHDISTRKAAFRDVILNKHALLIVDGVYTPEQIEDLLLPAESQCTMLITSTTKQLRGKNATYVDIFPLDERSGLALFQETMGRELEIYEQPIVKNIIDLVGGLALAIKVIAGNLATTPNIDIVEYYNELLGEHQLQELDDWNDTNKGVRASFELSYRALDDTLQKLFCGLGLYQGGSFSADVVTEVIGQSSFQTKKILDRLRKLCLIDEIQIPIPKLATSEKPQKTLIRYRLHNLLSRFATEKLQAHAQLQNELPIYQQRAAAYYTRFIETYATDYYMLDLEWHNLMTALPWGKGMTPNYFAVGIEQLTTLHLGVVGFLDVKGYWALAYEWFNEVLIGLTVHEDEIKAATWYLKAGSFAFRLSRVQEADALFTTAESYLINQVRAPDISFLYAYLCDFRSQYYSATDLEQAIIWSGRGVATLTDLAANSQQSELGYLQIRHATNLARQGQLNETQAMIEHALTLLPPSPNAAQVSGLITLGNIYDMQEAPAKAEIVWQQGIEAASAIGDNRRLADLWFNLATLADRQGRFDAAIQGYREALHIYERIGDIKGVADVNNNLAYSYLVEQSNPNAALPHLQKAETLVAHYGFVYLGLQVKINRIHWHVETNDLEQANHLLNEVWQLSLELGNEEAQEEIMALRRKIER